MGVRGLQRALESSGRPMTASQLPKCAVDLSCLLSHELIVSSTHPAVPDLAAITASSREFFACLGPGSVCYIDGNSAGTAAETKLKTVTARQEKEIDTVMTMFEGFESDVQSPLSHHGLHVKAVMDIVESENMELVRCIGEADAYIAAQMHDRNFDAIVSGDSDFFFVIQNNIRYIPLDSIRIDSAKKTVSWVEFTRAGVAKALGIVSPSHLWLLSAIAGNDYTTPFFTNDTGHTILARLGIKPSPHTGIPALKDCVDFVNAISNNAKPQLEALNAVFSGNPGFRAALEHTNTMIESPKKCLEQTHLYPESAEPLVQLIRQGSISSSVLRSAILGWTIIPVIAESFQTAFASEDLILPWVAALNQLVEQYRSPKEATSPKGELTVYCRDGMRFAPRVILLSNYLPEAYPKQLPAPNLSVAQRLWLVLSPLASICRGTMPALADHNMLLRICQNYSAIATPQNIPLQIKQLLFVTIANQLLFCGSAELQDPLTEPEIASFILMPLILIFGGDLNRQIYASRIPKITMRPRDASGSKISPTKADHTKRAVEQRKAVPPRIVSLSNRYQRIVATLDTMWGAAGLRQAGVLPPSASQVFDGPLLHYLLTESPRLLPAPSASWPFTTIAGARKVIVENQNMWKFVGSVLRRPETLVVIQNAFEVFLKQLFAPLGAGIPEPRTAAALLQNQQKMHPQLQPAIGLDENDHSALHDPEIAEPGHLDGIVANPGQASSAKKPHDAHTNRLPILDYRDDIIEKIATHRVVAIQGETGSGKSSQVPQFIVQEWERSGKHLSKTRPFIVVTQPRRIAAVTLARRVAEERKEPIGQTIGYAIGNERVGNSDGVLVLFVTTGWLLQKLLHNRAFFSDTTHFILDEVHERSIDSDLLYLLIKQLLSSTVCTTKVVLMSATFNTDLFVDYFTPAMHQALDICNDKTHLRSIPNLFVGVKRYPVEVVHLENLASHSIFRSHDMPYKANYLTGIAKVFNGQDPMRQANLQAKTEDDLHTLAVFMCGALAQHHRDDPGGNCILVFLAGLTQIDEMYELLVQMISMSNFASKNSSGAAAGNNNNDDQGQDLYGDNGTERENRREFRDQNIEIIVLHSTIDDQQQLRAFDPIPAGVTRVVLSTNIAESSVTIPAVRYVIDFGMVRQLHHDSKERLTRLTTMWVSRASALQRMGRCGRLFPGTVFRMYPEDFYERLIPNEIPEMLRQSLVTTVLRLKMLAETVEEDSLFRHPKKALEEALQAPEDDALRAAVKELVQTGALRIPQTMQEELAELAQQQGIELNQCLEDYIDSVGDEDHPLDFTTITGLGKFLSSLPLDPRVGRLVALGARTSRHLGHCIVIASALSLPEVFVLPHPSSSPADYGEMWGRVQLGRGMADNGLQSDAISAVQLYKETVHARKSFGTRWASKLFNVGINSKRVLLLLRSVSEIAVRLETALRTYHAPCLTVLAAGDRAPMEAIDNTLSMNRDDIDLLRFLIGLAFFNDGLVLGKHTPNNKGTNFLIKSLGMTRTINYAQSAQELTRGMAQIKADHDRRVQAQSGADDSAKGKLAKGKGKDGKGKDRKGKTATTANDDEGEEDTGENFAALPQEIITPVVPDNCVLFTSVPAHLLNPERFLAVIPCDLVPDVRSVFVSKPTGAMKPTKDLQKLLGGFYKGPLDTYLQMLSNMRVGCVIVEFKNTDIAHLESMYDAEGMPLHQPPLGVRTLIAMVNRDTIVFPPLPRGFAYEPEFKPPAPEFPVGHPKYKPPPPTLDVFSEPSMVSGVSRNSKITYTLGGRMKVAPDFRAVPGVAAARRDTSDVLGVAGVINFFEPVPGQPVIARCEKMTIIPSSGGLAALLIFVVSETFELTIHKGYVATVNVKTRYGTHHVPIDPMPKLDYIGSDQFKEILRICVDLLEQDLMGPPVLNEVMLHKWLCEMPKAYARATPPVWDKSAVNIADVKEPKKTKNSGKKALRNGSGGKNNGGRKHYAYEDDDDDDDEYYSYYSDYDEDDDDFDDDDDDFDEDFDDELALQLFMQAYRDQLIRDATKKSAMQQQQAAKNTPGKGKGKGKGKGSNATPGGTAVATPGAAAAAATPVAGVVAPFTPLTPQQRKQEAIQREKAQKKAEKEKNKKIKDALREHQDAKATPSGSAKKKNSTPAVSSEKIKEGERTLEDLFRMLALSSQNAATPKK